MKIDLEADEALVLFELLASAKLKEHVEPSEAAVLSTVLAALECELVEPFRSDYSALLASAKHSVLARNGG